MNVLPRQFFLVLSWNQILWCYRQFLTVKIHAAILRPATPSAMIQIPWNADYAVLVRLREQQIKWINITCIVHILLLYLSGDLEHVGEKICMTDGGDSPNKPCIFPFTFNGVVYNKCTWTSAHLAEHKPWCSTFVDETGKLLIFTFAIEGPF